MQKGTFAFGRGTFGLDWSTFAQFAKSGEWTPLPDPTFLFVKRYLPLNIMHVHISCATYCLLEPTYFQDLGVSFCNIYLGCIDTALHIQYCLYASLLFYKLLFHSIVWHIVYRQFYLSLQYVTIQFHICKTFTSVVFLCK